MTELKSRLPLPAGCTVSRYFRDMREVAQYQIMRDEIAVRYDWLRGEEKQTFHAEPIDSNSRGNFRDFDEFIEGEMAKRREACLKHRGLP